MLMNFDLKMAGVLSTIRKSVCLTSNLHCDKVFETKPVLSFFVRCKSEQSHAEGYQYIEKSAVPTMHFQESLLRLPIPDLVKTCERYLRAQEPLLSTEQLSITSSCVKDFVTGAGQSCQSALKKKDDENKHTSYISEPWFKMYLSDRIPLPINYNPFLVFVNNKSQAYNSQLIKSANLIISSLRFFKSLNENLLAPEIYHMNPDLTDSQVFKRFTGVLPKSVSCYGAYLFKAFPLDMSQYHNLFSTTRVPEVNKDKIVHYKGQKHISVMRRGWIFVFDVIDKDGNIMPPQHILSNLEQIMQKDLPVAKHPVGLLTSENRDVWAKARAHLKSCSTLNSAHLEVVDSSLLHLALDDTALGSDPIRIVRSFMHGDGVNRWFDKSFTLIVSQDGVAGLNFEHSWGDGVAVLRYFNDVLTDSTKKPNAHPDTPRIVVPELRKLEFHLDDKAKSMIDEAKAKYAETCKSLEVRVLDYQKFGRQLCKPHKISPDAMMQLAFQIAHDRTGNRPVPTYESCSTAAFKHGRTETVRPCTLETNRVCKALRGDAKACDRTVLQEMIKECSKVHSQLIKEAAMGHGFDRHLFALRLEAEAMGLKPAIFDDPAYAALNHNILSTSTLASENLMLGAFGPVVRDGFGIGYSMWSQRLGSIVTNYAGQADGEQLVANLEYSLDKIHQILCP